MNNVCLIGRITKDPELRYTPSNVANAQFTLAVNREYKNANGEYEADFINCVAWKQTAEFVAKYAKKGNQLGITGSIQTRNYQAQDGTTRYVTEVIAKSVVLCDKASNNAPSTKTEQTPKVENQTPKTADFDVKDVAEDDLPF